MVTGRILSKHMDLALVLAAGSCFLVLAICVAINGINRSSSSKADKCKVWEVGLSLFPLSLDYKSRETD